MATEIPMPPVLHKSFPVQLSFFNPSKEIHELNYNVACPPAVPMALAERGRISLFHKNPAARFYPYR